MSSYIVLLMVTRPSALGSVRGSSRENLAASEHGRSDAAALTNLCNHHGDEVQNDRDCDQIKTDLVVSTMGPRKSRMDW